MTRAILLILILVSGVLKIYSQTEAWRANYDFSIGAHPNLYPSRDIGREIGFDAAGNVYMLVSSIAWLNRTSESPVEYYIFKYNRGGVELWHKNSGRAGLWFPTMANLCVTPTGDVYRAYTSYYYYYHSPDNFGGGKHDANISRLCSNGILAWSAQWNNEQYNENDWVIAFDVDDNENVYLLIRSNFSNSITYSNYSPVLQKYDRFGNQLWESRLEGNTAYDIATDATGNVFVLQHGIIRKYDAASGNPLGSGVVEYFWDDDGLPTNPTYWAPVVGYSIKVGPQGNVYVAGFAEQKHWFWVGPGTNDWDYEYHNNIYTAKFDSDCNLLWRDQYGSHEYEDYPKELIIDSNGNILVTGPTDIQLVTLKYLPDGTLDQTTLYSDDEAEFHIIDDYVYTLESPLSDTSAPSLHQYRLSTGNEEWQIQLPDLLSFSDMNVDPGGDLYISGSVHDGEPHSGLSANYANDMVLIKYDIPDCCNGVNNDGNEYMDLPDEPDCPAEEPEPILRCITFLGQTICFYLVRAFLLPIMSAAAAGAFITAGAFFIFRRRKKDT